MVTFIRVIQAIYGLGRADSRLAYRRCALAYRRYAMAYRRYALAYRRYALAYRRYALAYRRCALAYRRYAMACVVYATAYVACVASYLFNFRCLASPLRLGVLASWREPIFSCRAKPQRRRELSAIF